MRLTCRDKLYYLITDGGNTEYVVFTDHVEENVNLKMERKLKSYKLSWLFIRVSL